MSKLIPRLLHIDGSGALIAGILVLLANPWLSEWYGLPPRFVIFIAIVNLAYAAYSLSLARASVRPMPLIILLVVANLSWTAACFSFARFFFATAHPLGIAHLLGEGVFVGLLAVCEWTYRHQLLRR
jgi:hypothetical protein